MRIRHGQTAQVARAWLLRWHEERTTRFAEVRYRRRERPCETRQEWVEESRVVFLDGEDYSRATHSRWGWDPRSHSWVELTEDGRLRSVSGGHGGQNRTLPKRS